MRQDNLENLSIFLTNFSWMQQIGSDTQKRASGAAIYQLIEIKLTNNHTQKCMQVTKPTAQGKVHYHLQLKETFQCLNPFLLSL